MKANNSKEELISNYSFEFIDPNGTNLKAVKDMVCPNYNVKFSEKHLTEMQMMFMYNLSDVTINIASNEIKNLNVVEIICDVLDRCFPNRNKKSYKELITFVQDRPGHDFRYAIDSTKINSKLGWSPKESFESGLEKTILWYINNVDWWKSILDNTYNQQRLGISQS